MAINEIVKLARLGGPVVPSEGEFNQIGFELG